ncbi:MAG TPA: glycosyltransferase family 4 protein [Candidatus Angelobacter sp.]|nr:glycosyltransferase family 4 protein [Candidatus Angelobacter sp.]
MLALIDQGHDVTVITRSNNRFAIDAHVQEQSLKVKPEYYDLPAWCRRWKRLPGGLYLYYLLWQAGAYRRARQLHRATPFELVHHITFVTFRQPSFMGGLGIPFLLGPVGGGETSPLSLRPGMNSSGRLREALRDIAIAFARFDPLMSRTFSKASLIACTTNETLRRIPARFRTKCVVHPAIGISLPHAPPPSPALPSDPTFLFVGRLLYWKGLHLALRAMPEVLHHVPNARLKIVGEGRDARWLKQVAEECEVAAHVDWVPHLPHDEIATVYGDKIALIFPSLHDSGGMVVLESLAARLPVICLALGGPGLFVDSSCGVVIDPANKSEELIVRSLATAMIQLARQPSLREALAANCVARARHFTWRGAAEHLYSHLQAAEQV